MIFHALRAARGFAKKHLEFIKTAEDFDLVCEIGYHANCGSPLTMKRLLLQDIASAATLHRRLSRLKQLGAVLQRKSAADARMVEFLLASHVDQAFERYGELFAMIGARKVPADVREKPANRRSRLRVRRRETNRA